MDFLNLIKKKVYDDENHDEEDQEDADFDTDDQNLPVLLEPEMNED